MDKLDVIIPARNEEKTLGQIIYCFTHTDNVGHVIVVDDKSTDETARIARAGYACVIPGDGEGKGQAVLKGLKHVSTDRVILCDADYTHMRIKYAEAMTEDYPGILMGITDFVQIPPWTVTEETYNALTGFRAVPTELLRELPLHGYAMEVQINVAARIQDLPFKEVQCKGMRNAARWNQRRFRDMERDYNWLVDIQERM